MSHIENNITAAVVDNHKRMGFMPKLFGNAYIRGEMLVYAWMQELCSQYRGGYWKYVELSNGSGYMAPDRQEVMTLIWEMNYSNETLSADGAGIVATLYAMNQLINNGTGDEAMIEKFYALRDYAAEHADGTAIYRLID